MARSCECAGKRTALPAWPRCKRLDDDAGALAFAKHPGAHSHRMRVRLTPPSPPSRPCRRADAAAAAVVVILAVLAVPGLSGCATGAEHRRADRTPQAGDARTDDDRGDDDRTDDDRGDSDDERGAADAPTAAHKDPARRMTVHLLDVGQGAATLIEFPCGAMLVDTGGEDNEEFKSTVRLKQQLDAFFDRRTDLRRTLDLLVITHPHIDHVRGLPTVLHDYVVKNVVDDGRDGDELVKEQVGALRAYVTAHGTGYRAVGNADIVKKGGLTDDVIDPFRCEAVDPVVRVLSGGVADDPGWGTDNWGKLHFDNENNHSVVVRVDVGNASLLITGDLEERAIAGLLDRYRGTRWLDVDLYQVGHHGSHNGTTRALVAAMTPHVALIAMGPESRRLPWTAWTYGHPRADVVRRLEKGVAMARPHTTVPIANGPKKFTGFGLHKAIYGTGWDGAVSVDMGVDDSIAIHVPGTVGAAPGQAAVAPAPRPASSADAAPAGP
jgi:competence protein ComEC